MKRAISFFLSLIMVIGICTAVPFAKVEASAIEASDIFKVTAGDFENNKITYTVYIKQDKCLLGSILYVRFDPEVLSLDEDNTGACLTTDSYGDEIYSIGGVYEQGFMSGYDNQYAIAHVYGTESDYKAGSSDKQYIQFTFEVVDETRPETNVSIYCYELKSRTNPENDIPNGSENLISSDTRTTLGKVNIESVKTEKNGIRIKWERLTGADSYIVYKNNTRLDEVSDTAYLDSAVDNNTAYSYTVRAVNEVSGDKAPLSNAVSIKYLAAPSGISLTGVCNKVVVEWQVLDGASIYQVCRRTVNDDGTVSDWTSFDKVSGTKYSDETVVDGTKYEYAVCGWSENDSSVLSDAAEMVYIAGTHSFGDWVIASEPTCTVEGRKTKTCSLCGYIVTEAIGVVEHTYSTEWTVDAVPTCVTTGSKSRHCLNCDSKTDVTVIPATGHTEVKIPAVEATCEKDGKTEGSHCSVCGLVFKEQTVVDAKPHKLSSWKTDKKATVNAAGSKHKECTECGKVLETATIKQLKCSKPSLKKLENTKDGVKITWGKVTGADSYVVYRKTGSGSYKKIATVKGNSKVTYTDKSAKSGKKYYYNVKAVNEAGSSEASKAKSILYLADTTLSTPKSTKSGITLKWKKVAGAEGYQVWRKTGNGSYSKIATVKGNSKVTYTDKKASKGKTYTYKIKAYKGKTTSAYSNTKKIKDKY